MGAQEDLYHAQVRHAIGVRNLSSGYVKDMLAVLDKANAELEVKLTNRLKPGTSLQSKRWKNMQADIKVLRSTLWKQQFSVNKKELVDLAKAEQQFAKQMFQTHIPIQLDYNVVSAQHLRALVTTQPFAGGANAARTLAQWWGGLRNADSTRILESLQLGMVNGETVPQMVARVRQGMVLTRANAEAVVRTGVNHASNQARGAFHKENADILQSLMWSAMLDGRTTATCRGRDGHHAPADGDDWTGVPQPHLETASTRPPAHPSCRSQMIAMLSALGLEAKMPARPFVRDTRTRRWREKDFRADARNAAGAKKWKKWNVKQRNAAIKRQRVTWTKDAVGTAPAGLSYDSWLRKQPVAFQNQTLGIAKGKVFRKGLKLDQFTDRRGSELTLVQLKQKFPSYL